MEYGRQMLLFVLFYMYDGQKGLQHLIDRIVSQAWKNLHEWKLPQFWYTRSEDEVRWKL